jgi:hypothetical protein
MRKLSLSPVTTVEANIHTFEPADSMPAIGLPTTAVTSLLALPAGVAGNASWRHRHGSSLERRADRCHSSEPALVT